MNEETIQNKKEAIIKKRLLRRRNARMKKISDMFLGFCVFLSVCLVGMGVCEHLQRQPENKMAKKINPPQQKPVASVQQKPVVLVMKNINLNLSVSPCTIFKKSKKLIRAAKHQHIKE